MLGQILLYSILFVLASRTLTLYYFGIIVPDDVYILLGMDGWLVSLYSYYILWLIISNCVVYDR